MAKVRRILCVNCGTKLPAWTNVRQEHWEGDLAVEGHLPSWLRILLNHPAHTGERSFHHIFEGYATLVRISFQRGRATGAHRLIESEAYKVARTHGRPIAIHREFSSLCPRKPGSLLDRVRNVIGLSSGSALSDNANISVFPLGDGRVICLTETTKSSVLIDPETLHTIGKFHYNDMLWGMLQSTHPVVTSTELLTLLPDLFRRSHRVVRMVAGSNERKVLGRVHCRGGMAPGWVHSFAVTENYIIVPEMPLRYSVTGLLKVARFRIPLDGTPTGELQTVLDPNKHGRGVELCSINPANQGKEYRYFYACGAQRPCNFFNSLTKIDLVGKVAKNWYEEGSVPSEPFFVARPGATNEDDGVVISVVSTTEGEGYGLLLDAATFEEVVRVRFPYGLPYGFHGCWIPKKI